jgi:hypothetical protein
MLLQKDLCVVCLTGKKLGSGDKQPLLMLHPVAAISLVF